MQPLTIAKNLFKEFDLDDSGSIGFDEFKIMMKDIYQEDSEKVDETILREFHKVDQDHSGQLSVNGNRVFESFEFRVVNLFI